MGKDSTDAAWAKVKSLAQSLRNDKSLLEQSTCYIESAGVTLDCTRALVNDDVYDALAGLADSCKLGEKFTRMTEGGKVNDTEGRAAAHTRLRDPDEFDEILEENERMLAFAEQLASGETMGASGKPVTHLLHIGIGGSYLGPRLLCEALPRVGPECRFVANIDPAAFAQATADLDPGTTMVVAVSKSGKTSETIENTNKALAWIDASCGEGAGLGQLVVVSANPQAAGDFGCPAERSFAMQDWVGGRYSVWSPAGLSAAASVGAEAFREFLAGAFDMDMHTLAFHGLDNIPVTLALLRAWHSVLLDAQTHCVVAYQHRLRSLPAYLQQLVMESNGKSATVAGKPPPTPTSAIWWGGEGTNDQHSYFQLLLQGTRPVSADFIVAKHPQAGEDENMHRQLVAHCLGQALALHKGKSAKECEAELIGAGRTKKEAAALARHMAVPGGRPTNLLSIDRLDPRSLGALVAMYEHMTVFLGWMWGINPFDQWGVELGKKNYRSVLEGIGGGKPGGLDKAALEAIERMSS